MAGWDPVTHGQTTDWSNVAILNQFYEAINERHALLFGTKYFAYPVAVGDDVQDVGFVRTMQQWVESNCVNFVRYGDFSGETDVEWYTWTTLKADAGINSGGWKRHVPDGSGGYTTAYGVHTAGDYICPHLWNELKAALNCLYAIYVQCQAFKGDLATNKAYSGMPFGETWAAAKSAAESGYTTDWDTGGQLYAFSNGTAVYDEEYEEWDYYAALQRRRGYIRTSSASIFRGFSGYDCSTRALDWYVKAAKPDSDEDTVYDTQGDPVHATESKYNKWATNTSTDAQPVAPSVFGTLDMPTWCAEPVGRTDDYGEPVTGSSCLGYNVVYLGAVVYWNVAGGFHYY